MPDEPIGRGPAHSENSGSGIHNLSDRVTALGGLLSAGVGTDGRFRLTAVVPLRPGVSRTGDRGGLAGVCACRPRLGFAELLPLPTTSASPQTNPTARPDPTLNLVLAISAR